MGATRYAVLLSFVLSVLATTAAGQEDAKEFSIVVDRPENEYTINVGGTMDPENLEITMENLGDTPVVNPRITVNGLYDWYDAKSLAAEITRGCSTDEEKALAIWWWIRYRTYQRSPHDDDSALHPVRALNGYGYGICGHVAAWMKCLWTAAGVPGRVSRGGCRNSPATRFRKLTTTAPGTSSTATSKSSTSTATTAPSPAWLRSSTTDG